MANVSKLLCQVTCAHVWHFTVLISSSFMYKSGGHHDQYMIRHEMLALNDTAWLEVNKHAHVSMHARPFTNTALQL